MMVPGDKSLSHRALIFSAMGTTTTNIENLSDGRDVQSTLACLRQLGVTITQDGPVTRVTGVGMKGFRKSSTPLDCGNSGTTMRLLMGLLAAQDFDTILIGDESLMKRPMARVQKPLAALGAKIELRDGKTAPVSIFGHRKLMATHVVIEVASAQVKSAVILVALFSEGETVLSGKLASRDHTERYLRHLGVSIAGAEDGVLNTLSVMPIDSLLSRDIKIPGDPSSAAFLIAAAILTEQELTIENVLLNPMRTGFFRVLERMGADIKLKITTTSPEHVGSVTIKPSRLHGTIIESDEIASLVDEVPLIAVLAAFAKGTTVVSGAEELRFKESDRLEAIAANLTRMGCNIKLAHDGFSIEGQEKLQATTFESFGDHRIAMAFSVAAVGLPGLSKVLDSECADISYPGFFQDMKQFSIS
jgi:3-phosphoshikimate 1-carboxyvinyltransferase